MEYFPAPLEKLVEQFARLPGIGGKSAQRLAFHVLNLPMEEAESFANAIIEAKRGVTLCPVCRNLTAGGLCSVCADPKRDETVICVVADPRDVLAIERSREFNGHYHVLHGVLSPMNHAFAEYIRAKKLFFDGLPKGAFALTNADDRNGRVMVQNTAAAVSAYSLRAMADFRCKIVEMHLDGMLLRIDGQELWVGLLGRFNAYNLLAVYGAAALLGLDRGEVLRVLSMLHAVSGRFEKIRAANGTTAIVDYAHTPDALENVIQTIEEIRTPGQQLIVVCGCGGDRDRTKRPEMAAIAVKYATTAVFTSDNPRHESPEAILDDMVAGLEPGARYLRIADRAEAIRTAVMLSRPGDIILVAGKGHETYQIVGDVKHPFDDREEIKKRFALLN